MKQGVTLARAALFGAVTGLRSMRGVAQMSRYLVKNPGDGGGDGFSSVLSNPYVANVLAVVSAGESVVDKLPGTSARTQPGPLAFRALVGGLVGAAVCSEKRDNIAAGVLIGAGAAVAASFGAYYLRRWLTSERGLPDAVVALAEDSLALALGQRAATM